MFGVCLVIPDVPSSFGVVPGKMPCSLSTTVGIINGTGSSGHRTLESLLWYGGTPSFVPLVTKRHGKIEWHKMPLAATSTKDKLLDNYLKKKVVVHMAEFSQQKENAGDHIDSWCRARVRALAGGFCCAGDQRRVRMVTESARVRTSGLLAEKRQAWVKITDSQENLTANSFLFAALLHGDPYLLVCWRPTPSGSRDRFWNYLLPYGL